SLSSPAAGVGFAAVARGTNMESIDPKKDLTRPGPSSADGVSPPPVEKGAVESARGSLLFLKLRAKPAFTSGRVTTQSAQQPMGKPRSHWYPSGHIARMIATITSS